MEPPVLYVGSRVGLPFQAGPYQCTPESFVVRFHWLMIGFVWNWPLALNITRDGRSQRARVVDITRLVAWGLWLVAIGAGLSAGLISMRSTFRASTKRSVHSE